MLRMLGPLSLALLTCAGPSTQVPPDAIQKAVVVDAVALGERCEEINDLTSLAWSWAQVCDDDIEYGFSPDRDSKPPITMQLPPLTRRTITIPRSYGLRGRLAHAEEGWSPTTCTATRSGTHLTFNADCRTCTADGIDPLRRADCVEAGSCPPPSSR